MGRVVLLAVLLAGCLEPLESEPGDNIECESESRPGLGTIVAGKLRYAFIVEGGEVRVTGDVEDPLRCKIRP